MRKNKETLYLVTGADWSHARSLLQLLNSLSQFEPGIRTVIYDLGMTVEQRAQVTAAVRFGAIETFPYKQFPPFFDISVNAGEYAWKPTILALEMAKSDAPVCWMDAGNVLFRRLRHIRAIVRRMGFYGGASPGTIGEYTHPGMLGYLGLPSGWGSDLANLSAACVAFDPLNRDAKQLAHDWAQFALEKNCIAPVGSSRANHRQDQALLTVLAYRNGVIKRPTRKAFWGREYEAQHDLLPESYLLERSVPESMRGLLDGAKK